VKTEIEQAEVEAVRQLAGHALAFGRISRTASDHPDGQPESDSDHTVALAWIAPALAERYYPHLDTCLVATFAVVHDAVEVFAGDTCTLRIDAAGRAAKEGREAAALLRWQEEFGGTLPWIADMIARYEALREPEARFVKAVDKICPGLVHLNCGCRDLAGWGFTAREAEEGYAGRRSEMEEYAGDFPRLLDLRDEIFRHLVAGLREQEENRK
jgi:putative hydrolases of HD superfamily